LILAAIMWLLLHRPLDLKSLPPKVRWQYEQYQANSSAWEKAKTGTEVFYQKKLDPTKHSEEYTHCLELVRVFMEASDRLKFNEVFAIYNPSLISNFINCKNIFTTRIVANPEIFNKQEWRIHKQANQEFVSQKFDRRITQAKCNFEAEVVPILPVVHGTDFSIAMAICSTGFAALSSLDAGWYGVGVYFTTYCMYSLPYFGSRKDPAIILSWVIAGNIYPVIESHTSDSSLLGAVIKPGCNSHYVMLTAMGVVPDVVDEKNIDGYFDEIVIQQEAQITPAYVIRLDVNSIQKLLDAWDKHSRGGKGKRAIHPSSSKSSKEKGKDKLEKSKK